jgi:hypothetical protein
VLRTLHEDDLYPSILAVEFDQPMPVRGVEKASRELQARGYDLVAVDAWNFTFVRSSI